MSNEYRTLEWISSAEQLPNVGETVLLSFLEPDVVTTGFLVATHGWICHETGLGLGRHAVPTHWALMPRGMDHSNNRREPIGFGHPRR